MKKGYKVDTEGFYVEDYTYDENVIINEDNIILENITESLYKPKWDGDKWVEGATQEYINNISTIEQEEPSEAEVLMSSILLENATLKQQMTEQQELTATLMLQIAELKGGSTSV